MNEYVAAVQAAAKSVMASSGDEEELVREEAILLVETVPGFVSFDNAAHDIQTCVDEMHVGQRIMKNVCASLKVAPVEGRVWHRVAYAYAMGSINATKPGDLSEQALTAETLEFVAEMRG